MNIAVILLAAAAFVDFDSDIGRIRPELHSSGFGPQICSCSQNTIDEIKSMKFKASRTHDWSLINPNQRVCDYFHIFPLMHLDAKDPKNYVFGPTDYLLKRTREEVGHDIFFRLGTSIEHSGPKIHFNSLIPEDFDKVAEIFAATIRHYNHGWADGYKCGIKYWEIWNEPDGINNMWCLPDGDEGKGATEEERKADGAAREIARRDRFVKFFVTVLKRIKSEFPDVKVGGPALCSMKTEYFAELFKACKAAQVAPDFISWHAYSRNPGSVMRSIDIGRQICDDFGYTSCELIINEWHFLGEHEWSGLRSSDADVQRQVWSGPASHNGIDSSCFNLTLLSMFQTSKLDQAYYYGCRNIGTWGYMDALKNKYKVYYGLKLFGEFANTLPVICESSADDGLTVLAAKTEDGKRKGFIVTDYRAGTDEIIVDIKGVRPGSEVWAWVHDYGRNFERYPVRFVGGRIRLQKADRGSAAFSVWF